MSQIDVWTNYAPLALLAVASAWGLGRIFYLSKVQNVTVMSFFSQRKSAAERGLGLVAVLSNIYIVLRPFVAELDSLVYRQPSPAPFLAIGIMTFGIFLMIYCQAGMGSAWRIGVPEHQEDSQKLVTNGIYNRSRNPIYLAVLIYLAGLFLLLPGPFTAVSCLATFVFLHPVIAREEAFLEHAFGQEFRDYKQRVRRWI